MNNREVEKVILKRIQESYPKIKAYISSDVVGRTDLQIPRVVSQTLSTREVSTLHEWHKLDANYMLKKEITTRKHFIQLTFLLNDNFDINDVEFIKRTLKHKLGMRHYFLLNNINLVIHSVGDTINSTEYDSSYILPRYNFDIEIASIEEHSEKIEIVKKVEFDLKGVKK